MQSSRGFSPNSQLAIFLFQLNFLLSSGIAPPFIETRLSELSLWITCIDANSKHILSNLLQVLQYIQGRRQSLT